MAMSKKQKVLAKNKKAALVDDPRQGGTGDEQSTGPISDDNLTDEYEKMRSKVSQATSSLFDQWDSELPVEDLQVTIPVDSLESRIGYSSLFRQLHQAYVRRVAYHRSPGRWFTFL